MKIRSLGRRTDLLFARAWGRVIDRGSYVVVQNPENPGFHWGNFIIFDRPPSDGDLHRWKALYQKEFPYYDTPKHYTFTWDTPSPETGEVEAFTAAGFELDSAVVLTTDTLERPAKYHSSVQVRPIESEVEWEQVTELQTLCADPKYFNAYYEDFKRKQTEQYRKLVDDGVGWWFGAFLDGKLIGDLGLFFEEGLGRYQNVETHPDYRRRGVCGALVYEAGCWGLTRFSGATLVMEADTEYHAAKIYESVGFRRREVNHSLSWWER